MKPTPGILTATAAAVIALLALAAPASATDFCVPAFSTACPNDGTNVAKSTLTEAMTSNGSDGTPDKVTIAPVILSEPDSIVGQGTDPLEVIGSGTGDTQLTTTSNDSIFVVNLVNRDSVKMSNLSIAIPAGMPDGQGAGLQILNAQLEGVDVISLNPGAGGMQGLYGNNLVVNSHVYGISGGSISDAFRSYGGYPGFTSIHKSTAEDSDYGFFAGPGSSMTVANSRVIDATAGGLRAVGGAHLGADNVLVTTNEAPAIDVHTLDGFTTDTQVLVRNSTLVNTGENGMRAIWGEVVSDTGGGSLEVSLSDSIVRGFSHNWDFDVPVGPGFGGAELEVRYSNFADTPAEDSGGSANLDAATNIDADPKFVGPADFHLRPGSPSVDAGDPAPGGLGIDIEFNGRPFDGDSDGTAVRDQGAYELLASCATNPALCPDTSPVRLRKVKFRFRYGKGGALRLRVSKASTVRVVFKPVPKKKRKVVRLVRKVKKPGAVVFNLGKRRLRPGRYVLRINAVDKLGISAKTIVRKWTWIREGPPRSRTSEAANSAAAPPF